MRNKSFILRGVVLAVVFLLPQVHAEPRVPMPALPSSAIGLYHNRFDDVYWHGKERGETVQTETGILAESWSGYALQRAGRNVAPFVVPAVGERGQLNVACDFGSVGFWFKPYWTSAAVSAGNEPGVAAQLVDLVVIGTQDAAIGWSLQASADGNSLQLIGGNGERVLRSDIAWSAGEWHWIVLNYGEKGTALYVDDGWVAEGDVTLALPPKYSGLVLGSSVLGDETAGGEFEDFYCYRNPMTAKQPSFGYAGIKKRAALGAISAEETAALAKRREEMKVIMDAKALLAPEGESGGGVMMRMMSGLVNCVTNMPAYITNASCSFVTNQGWTVTFDVQGTNTPVDIFMTTNLVGNNITNSQWVWLERGPSCATYQYTNQSNARSFYILGKTNDTDSDGLTDAFELLVSKTLVSTNDTDGDGMPDGWEVNNGLNPLVDDAGDDPDGDWKTNLQEYNGGTNSTDPHDVMVVAWGDNTAGQCDVPFSLRDVVKVAAGFDFSVALRKDGGLVVWGNNSYGQTNVPASLTNVVSISASWEQIGAVTADGRAVTWGLTNGTVPTDFTNGIAIAVGDNHVLGQRSNHQVVAWGANGNGQCDVPGVATNVQAITAGWSHSAALLADHSVKAWGANWSVFGWGVTNPPAGLSNVTSLAAGGYHTLALRSDGTVAAWGAGHDTNSITFADFGQSIVPSNVTNITAVAAGGHRSLALRADGTLAAWGYNLFGQSDIPVGLSNVVGMAAGPNHTLAIRTGRQLPFIILSPKNTYAPPGSNALFTSYGLGLAEVKYQWQFNGMNLTGQTNLNLSLSSVSTNNGGSYTVVFSTGAGSITSSVATLTLVTPPQIVSVSPAVSNFVWVASTTNLTVNATALGTNDFPISYLWKRDGVIVTNVLVGLPTLVAYSYLEGDYSVTVSNIVGTTNVSYWRVKALLPGGVAGWGANTDGQLERPAGLTDTLSITAGKYHSVAVRENGSVNYWGYSWASLPSNLTNIVSASAGYAHTLALRDNGTVTSWGLSGADANAVPTNNFGVKAIAAGTYHNVALLTNGSVVAWGNNAGNLGWNLTQVPTSLTNATAVAAGTYHSLALREDGTVVSWGYSESGQTNVPSGLSNVVAIAAGQRFSLALKSDGTITAWGQNGAGQCNVPAGLSNVMAIAAGWEHGAALKNDGTVVGWGANGNGQTNAPALSLRVKLIAAGGDHTLVSIFSPLVQYPVDVSKDLLLIYNSNSVASEWVMNYYRTNRPMVSGANVLGIYYNTNEWPAYPGRGITSDVNLANQVLTPYQNWLSQNPTKRPQYIIWFYDLPVQVYNDPTNFPSPSYYLHTGTPNHHPFVTCINMRTTNDCKAYIDKLAAFGTNNSLFISASAGNYWNTNYVVDNVREYAYANAVVASVVFYATNGLLAAGVSPSSIIYSATNQPCLAFGTNGVCISQLQLPQHQITNATDVAGYISWGAHSTWLGANYAVDGKVKWTGNSAWWIIETVESYNGQRDNPNTGQSDVLDWFSAGAFGGTNYHNTPVGAVSHVEEPGVGGVNDAAKYFGFWASGKCFGSAAWNSANTAAFQAVGDPFVRK